MKICGTGHLPQHLPGGFSPDTFHRLVSTAGAWLDINPQVTDVINGMALGWDQALAQAALDRGLPVHAMIPCVGQADNWPTASHAYYQRLLAQCASRTIVCHGAYRPEMMQIRNEAMVDQAELVLALWNGEPGGTANCLGYAAMEGKPIVNLWVAFSL